MLNQPLADRLHVKVGDEVLLRLPQANLVPADSALGKKSETSRSRRFTVSDVIAAEGLGRFGLRPKQQLPLDAFTAIEPLQRMIDVPNRANAILVAGGNETDVPGKAAEQSLDQSIRPTLADYGLSLRKTDRGYFDLTSERMLLEPAVAAVAMKAFGAEGAQPVFTYLANYIMAGEGRGKIPYSTIAAVDFFKEPPLGPLLNREGRPIGPLAIGEIVLNSWAADDLAAQGTPVKPGDTIEITYFRPESTHGQVEESSYSLRLKDVTPLSGLADDPNFTPQVKGITDEASIADWNPPFPFDSARVRSAPPKDQDDKYWRDHRATPKAFVSLAQGRSLWGSRFGDTTSVRIPAREGMPEQSLADRLLHELDPKALGFDFMPVKQLGLAAAAGTTPFALLFLAFSMFIIVAALMLVAVLFKLGVDQRAADIGIMLGVGFRRRPGAARAASGSALRGDCRCGSRRGGRHWLRLADDRGAENVVVGGDLHAVSRFVRQTGQHRHRFRQRRVGVAGDDRWGDVAIAPGERATIAGRRDGRNPARVSPTEPLAGVDCRCAAAGGGGECDRLGFLGDGDSRRRLFWRGALVLAALLTRTWHSMRADHGSSLITGRVARARLAWRNASRNPLRSTLTIGLTAAACFLILALSGFRLDPPKGFTVFRGGDGGFALMAQSAQPIYQDLGSAGGRRELGFSEKDDRIVATAQGDGSRIFSFRVHSGDDASCLNLYRPRQPRIVGVRQQFMDRGGFAWTAKLASTPMEGNDPWLLLDRVPPASETKSEQPSPIPVILDQNTAIYSLHLTGGAGGNFRN